MIPKDCVIKLVFASGNRGKLKEVREVAAEYGGISVFSPEEVARELGLSEPPEVIESGATYRENAVLKAHAHFIWCGLPSLGDDSGLEVQVLNGAPGLTSARYAGEKVEFSQNLDKLLQNLDGISDRRALFRSVLFCRFSDFRMLEAEDELTGRIAEECSGAGGFGYDPIFIPDGYSESLAVLKEAGHPIQTHRVKALHKLFQQLRS